MVKVNETEGVEFRAKTLEMEVKQNCLASKAGTTEK